MRHYLLERELALMTLQKVDAPLQVFRVVIVDALDGQTADCGQISFQF